MKKIKLILADDHSVLRIGLKLLLNNEPDFLVVGEAADGAKLLTLLETTTADILIIDLSMPNVNGLECITEIHEREYPIKIIVLTMYEDEQYIKSAMQAGAWGYVEKQVLDSELFQAIRTVYEGSRYLSPRNTQLLLNNLLTTGNQLAADSPFNILSVREREVLRLLIRGYSLSQIAKMLFLSVKTIDTYKTRIMDKLRCSNKIELFDCVRKYNFL